MGKSGERGVRYANSALAAFALSVHVLPGLTRVELLGLLARLPRQFSGQ